MFLPAIFASGDNWSESHLTCGFVFCDRFVDGADLIVLPCGAAVAEVRLQPHAQLQEGAAAITHNLSHPKGVTGLLVTHGTEAVLSVGGGERLEALELGQVPGNSVLSNHVVAQFLDNLFLMSLYYTVISPLRQ